MTAAVIFFTATALIGTFLTSIHAAQANLDLQRAEAASLESQNAHLRANKVRLEAIQAVLDEATVARPVKRRFFEALNRSRPQQISIRSVVLNEATWAIAATAHEGVGQEKGSYQSFVANFSKNEGWTIAPGSRAASLTEPDFTLNGTIP